jgi:hypothetical protein
MRPSCEKATALTGEECPRSVRNSRPLATSRSVIVVSSLPDASIAPSGENATAPTGAECPLYVRNASPLEASQNLTV